MAVRLATQLWMQRVELRRPSRAPPAGPQQPAIAASDSYLSTAEAAPGSSDSNSAASLRDRLHVSKQPPIFPTRTRLETPAALSTSRTRRIRTKTHRCANRLRRLWPAPATYTLPCQESRRHWSQDLTWASSRDL